jgi:23S rRNA (guanosine2251-2'-O)-methyltransferase
MKTMTTIEWEIRLCENSDCGLRYPAETGHSQKLRCPLCLGVTKAVLTYSSIDEGEKRLNSSLPIPVSGLLDNIRSIWNVGSIFRTSEGFGASHLYLTGITSTPDTADLHKTALGAEKTVAWSHHRNSMTLAKQLIKDGCLLWALETSSRAKPASLLEKSLDSALDSNGIILVLGNEKAGVDPGLLGLCHETFIIPMSGIKNSFNVAVTFGIALGLIRIAGDKDKSKKEPSA